LKIFDLPFAYGLISILSLYLQEATEFLSLERLGFIAVIGSATASFLAMYGPIERHLIPLLVLRRFKGEKIKSKGTDETLHGAFVRTKPFSINLYRNAREALYAKPLDRTRGVLTNTVYTMVLVTLLCISILILPPNYPLFRDITFVSRAITVTILLVFLVLLLYSFVEEIRKAPSKVFVEIIYLLVAQGVIGAGSNFTNIEIALNKNDWQSAYYWTMRMEREDKYGGLFLNDFLSTPIEIEVEKKRGSVRKKQKRIARSD